MNSSTPQKKDNEERLLLARILAEGLRDTPIPREINPLGASMGLVIREVRRGYVRLSFEIGAQFTQGTGVVQGGILATMADFGMAFAAISQTEAGVTVASVAVTVNYLRAAPHGHYEVVAEVEKMGSRVAFTRAVVNDAAGKTVATASSPLAVI